MFKSQSITQRMTTCCLYFFFLEENDMNLNNYVYIYTQGSFETNASCFFPCKLQQTQRTQK